MKTIKIANKQEFEIISLIILLIYLIFMPFFSCFEE